DYNVSVTQTDWHGNPQTGGTNDAGFTVRTGPPPAPSLALPAVVDGGSSSNPPAASGNGEKGDIPTVIANGVLIDGGTLSARCIGAAVASNGTWSCTTATWTLRDGASLDTSPKLK